MSSSIIIMKKYYKNRSKVYQTHMLHFSKRMDHVKSMHIGHCRICAKLVSEII